MIDEQKIQNLWKWFYANEQIIRESVDHNLASEQAMIVQNLDNLILDLGMFSWDIEKPDGETWSFTISPNGDQQLLYITKEIVSNAPIIKGWQIHYAKQAKTWDGILNLYDLEMDLRSIDTKNWRFITQQINSKIKLTIEAANTNNLDQETAMLAANMFLTNEIGEEARINCVGSIEIHSFVKDSKKMNPKELKSFIKGLNCH